VELESHARSSRSISKDRFAPNAAASPCHAAAASLTALSMDFVAKPSEAHRAHLAIPAAVASTMKGVAGYAGCLVMVSDQEARLITLITFWIGEQRARSCRENERWLRKLLAPYLEGCLRTRTFATHRAEMIEIRSNGETGEVHSLNATFADEPSELFAA